MDDQKVLSFRSMTEKDHINVLRFFRNHMSLTMKDHYITVHLHVTGKAPKHALGELSTQDMHQLELNFNRRSESLKLWGMMTFQDEQIVAVCLFSTKFCAHHGAIDFLLVRRSVRNRGLGTSLLQKCLQVVASERFVQTPSMAVCTVEIDAADPDAKELVKWYTARGFDKSDFFVRLGIMPENNKEKRIWRLVSASNESLIKNFAMHCRALGMNCSNLQELEGLVRFFASASTTATFTATDVLLKDVAKELAQL